MNDQVSLKDELITVLADNLKNCQLIVSEYQQQQLIDYVLMMHKWNKAYNLTSVRDPHQMVIKHVIDSIVVAPFLDKIQYLFFLIYRIKNLMEIFEELINQLTCEMK